MVERPAADVLDCVKTEGVNAHIDIIHVAVVDVICNRRVLGVNVNAVAVDLTGLLGVRLPAHIGAVVVVVRGINAVGLHAVKSCAVLAGGVHACIACCL